MPPRLESISSQQVLAMSKADEDSSPISLQKGTGAVLSSKFLKPIITRDNSRPQIGLNAEKLESVIKDSTIKGTEKVDKTSAYEDRGATQKKYEMTSQTSFVSSDYGRTTTEAVQFYQRKV